MANSCSHVTEIVRATSGTAPSELEWARARLKHLTVKRAKGSQIAKKNATPFGWFFSAHSAIPLRSLRLKALGDLSPQQVTQCLLHHRPADF